MVSNKDVEMISRERYQGERFMGAGLWSDQPPLDFVEYLLTSQRQVRFIQSGLVFGRKLPVLEIAAEINSMRPFQRSIFENVSHDEGERLLVFADCRLGFAESLKNLRLI